MNIRDRLKVTLQQLAGDLIDEGFDALGRAMRERAAERQRESEKSPLPSEQSPLPPGVVLSRLACRECEAKCSVLVRRWAGPRGAAARYACRDCGAAWNVPLQEAANAEGISL